MDKDKQTELQRYESCARSLLAAGPPVAAKIPIYGSLSIPPIFREPYIFYEQCIRKYVSKEHDVLELGSGTGLHTFALRQTGARVVASDISRHSLEVLELRIMGVTTVVADMEFLPFETDSFDVVASAGSLSYGAPALVNAEIQRVLRPGGIFVCVDSLNHNPAYRINRWLHYKRGERTRNTLLFMPTKERIQSLSQGFKSADIRYFGAVSYLMPLLARLVGQIHAARFSDVIDRLIHVRSSAFKFVMVARGCL